MLGMGFTKVANGIRRNDLCLAGAAVVTEELSISPAAIDDVGIRWIRRNVTALTGTGGVPVAEGDRSVITAAEDIDAAAILLRSVNVIRKLFIDSNGVKLRGRLIEPTAPSCAAVNAYARALVTAKDHPLRIAWIDPECVIVVAAGCAFDSDKSFSCIGGAVNRDVGDIHGVRIFGIDVNFAEIPQASDARIFARAQPRLAAIV